MNLEEAQALVAAEKKIRLEAARTALKAFEKEHQCQLVAEPVFIRNSDGTFSITCNIVIQIS